MKNLIIGFLILLNAGWLVISLFFSPEPEVVEVPVYVADKPAIVFADTIWSIPGQVKDFGDTIFKSVEVQYFTLYNFIVDKDWAYLGNLRDTGYFVNTYQARADVQPDSIKIDTVRYQRDGDGGVGR